MIDEAKHTKMKTYTAEEYKEKIAKEKQEKKVFKLGVKNE